MSQPLLQRLLRVLAAVACLVLVQCSESAPPPTIVLIVVDTLRADQLSIYGGPEGQTPHIDRLAEVGTRFSTARSVASWTAPSMAAMVTSLYPSQLGMVEADPVNGEPLGHHDARDQIVWTLPDEALTMAERLRAAGYRTGAFVDQPALHGFGQGFDDYFAADRSHRVSRREDESSINDQVWDDLGRATLKIDRELAATFGRWLETRDGRPVFAWVHLLTTHSPHLDQLEGEPSPGRQPFNRYAAEVRVTDAVVGDVLDAIERNVGLENAHVFFTSDHGEAFGEHGPKDRAHGHSLLSKVTHVPLIVASPSFSRGAVVDTSVRTIDILPTMLELAGTGGGARDGVEGRSLLDAASAQASETYAEGMLYGPTERSLVVDGFKLHYDATDDRYRLYDLNVDPQERHDVAEFHVERVAELRRRLDEHRAALRSRAVVPQDGEAGAEGLSESHKAALEALGYIE